MPDSEHADDDLQCVTRERDANGKAWRITTTWGEHAGRMEPMQVCIASTDQPVNAESIRRLPLATIIDNHRRRLIASNDWFARSVDDLEDATPQQRAAAKRQFQRRVDTLGARRGIALTPDDLEAVAKVYLDAYRRGVPVQQAVADQFGISRSTAANRIMLARRAGLLPPAS